MQYRDRDGVLRTLALQLPTPQVAEDWSRALQAVLTSLPGDTAYRRWALSCMESAHGAMSLPRSRLGVLLNRANVSFENEAFRIVLADAQCIELPTWTRAGNGQLHSLQVIRTLLNLTVQQPQIEMLHRRYAGDSNKMSESHWLEFMHTEQAASKVDDTHDAEDELRAARAQFERACRRFDADAGDAGLGRVPFALELLAPDNDAVAASHNMDMELVDGLQYTDRPLAHYWTSCSHNSYIVGDQLTGISSAEEYRRQLLQGCRCVEIDCWDGKKKPKVTHGHTLCTIERVPNVASAISDCAFVASELPVSLSLEMHCSPKQQKLIAADLIHFIGASLLTYDELCALGSAEALSPLALNGRVLAKGKVKAAKEGKAKNHRSTKKVKADILSAIVGFSVATSRRETDKIDFEGESPAGPESRRSTRRLFGFRGLRPSFPRQTSSSDDRQSDGDMPFSLRSMRDSSDDLTGQDTSARDSSAPTLIRKDLLLEASPGERYAHSRATQMRQRTDELYAGILTMRSRPFKEFWSDMPRAWPLTISSVQEDTLLRAMGLSKHERNELEGLTHKQSTTADAAADPILSLAYCPPKETGKLQFLTTTKLLRSYPLGLRFSGANMDPRPCWLAGAHLVALNMTNVDVPNQMHFALFNRTAGYVLKPQEMLNAPLGTGNLPALQKPCWPPARKQLHRTTLELLSLHNLPKFRERRPLLAGRREVCHSHFPMLSGTGVIPDSLPPLSPSVRVSLLPVGGFCAVTSSISQLPAQQKDVPTEYQTPRVRKNGLNAQFGQTVHCLAAERHQTFLRIAVTVDQRSKRDHEVAFEICVLGNLRRGYRVFRLRGALGTRIELSYLLVKVSFGVEPNRWKNARDLYEHELHNWKDRCSMLEAALGSKREGGDELEQRGGGSGRDVVQP